MDTDGFRTRLYDRYATALQRCTSESVPKGPSPFLDHVIRAHFPSDRSARVLDLACGSGALIARARLAGFTRVRGVDASPEQVSIAHAAGLSDVEEANIFEVLENAAEGSVDLITSFDIIEHLNKIEGLRLADGVRRVLSPNGRWLIHTVNGESPWFGRVRYGDITHEMVFTAGSLRQLLSVAGFARVECCEDRPVAHGMVSWTRHLLWSGLRQGMRAALAIETGVWSKDTILSQNFIGIGYKS